jgi:hypothetical protein
MSRGTTDIHCLEVDDQRIVHLCWPKGVSIGRIASTVAFNDCDVRHGLFFRPSFLEDLRESWIPGSFGPFDTCADFELCVSALASIRQVAQPKQKHVGEHAGVAAASSPMRPNFAGHSGLYGQMDSTGVRVSRS